MVGKSKVVVWIRTGPRMDQGGWSSLSLWVRSGGFGILSRQGGLVCIPVGGSDLYSGLLL